MRKDIKKILVTFFVILLCVAVIQWAKFFLSFRQDDPLRIASSRVKGNPDAPIKIIEYVDFRCGPCGSGTHWLKGFMDKHPDEVFVEVRYFPIHLAHGAMTARFAECSLRQNKFWEIHDALFQDQRRWMGLANAEDFFLNIAAQQGLDMEALEACWKDPAVYDEIMRIKNEGKELGVSATPTYFVNGTMTVGVKRLAEETARILNIEPDFKISP